MERTDFKDRVGRLIAEVKNYKMNQTVGGDSWVVYRAAVDVNIGRSKEYLVRFSPETNNDYVAVCKITSPDRATYGSIGDLIPDPNIKGRWWRPYLAAGGSDVLTTFFVYATVRGTVSVEEVTGRAGLVTV